MKRKFVLSEAEAMTPLVRCILRDAVEANGRHRTFAAKAAELEEARRAGRFDVRAAVYDLEQRSLAARMDFERHRDELAALGVELVDARRGVAAFPFRWSRRASSQRVRRAYFLLKLDADPAHGIRSWRFRGERDERRVPAHWVGQLSSPIVAETAY
jgi:hypothetical protein